MFRMSIILVLTAVSIYAVWYWFDFPVSLEGKSVVVDVPGGQMIDDQIDYIEQYKEQLDTQISAAKKNQSR